MGRELDTSLQQREHRPLLSEGGGYRESVVMKMAESKAAQGEEDRRSQRSGFQGG